MVGSGSLGLGGYADGGPRGGMGGGGGGDGRDGYGDRWKIRWEDAAANVILGIEHNASLAYDMGLKSHHPIISMLGGHGGQLDRDIDDIGGEMRVMLRRER